MRTLICVLPYESATDEFHLYPAPDIHAGNIEHQESRLDAWIARIKADDRAYWIGMGDYCEFINRRDKRYREESAAPWLWGRKDVAATERDWIIAKLKPIADKCIAMVKGNHEDTMQQWNERDVFDPLCEEMGSTAERPLALEYWGFIRLMFRHMKQNAHPSTWTCDAFATHGWWAGRLQGNGALNLERLGGWAQAQIVLAGHDHKLKTHKQVVVKPLKSGKVEEVTQVCASCGAFLNGAQYAEKAGYRPAPPGYQMLTIYPEAHHVTITM